jgi:hypothetical protein
VTGLGWTMLWGWVLLELPDDQPQGWGWLLYGVGVTASFGLTRGWF